MKPRFEVSPVNETCVQGENVTLTCDVSGIPTPEVTWTFSGGGIPANSRKISDGLVLYNVLNTERYEGVYTCHVQNVAGEIEGRVFLTVYGTSFNK